MGTCCVFQRTNGMTADHRNRAEWANTIFNLSCEHLSKTPGGGGDVSKLQCCWYLIVWLRLLEATLRLPLCMRPDPPTPPCWAGKYPWPQEWGGHGGLFCLSSSYQQHVHFPLRVFHGSQCQFLAQVLQVSIFSAIPPRVMASLSVDSLCCTAEINTTL